MFKIIVVYILKFLLKFCVKEFVYNWILVGICGGQDDGDCELG